MATSLKISPKLRARVAQAAKAAGKSPHAFMLDAIEAQTALAEQRRAFISDARAAEAEAIRSGLGFAAADVHAAARAELRGGRRALRRIRWRR